MRRSQILKMTFWVAFLIFVTGCATGNALVQSSKSDPPTPTVKVSIYRRYLLPKEKITQEFKLKGLSPSLPHFINYYPTLQE